MEEDKLISIGRRVKMRRKSMGLSQDDVADQSEILSQRDLWAYENGKTIPSIKNLLELARVLDVTPEFFFTDDSNTPLESQLLEYFRGLPDDRSRRTAIALIRVLRDESLDGS